MNCAECIILRVVKGPSEDIPEHICLQKNCQPHAIVQQGTELDYNCNLAHRVATVLRRENHDNLHPVDSARSNGYMNPFWYEPPTLINLVNMTEERGSPTTKTGLLNLYYLCAYMNRQNSFEFVKKIQFVFSVDLFLEKWSFVPWFAKVNSEEEFIGLFVPCFRLPADVRIKGSYAFKIRWFLAGMHDLYVQQEVVYWFQILRLLQTNLTINNVELDEIVECIPKEASIKLADQVADLVHVLDTTRLRFNPHDD